jgi:LPS sulfotransferase NodH
MKLIAVPTPRLSYLICATQRTGSTLLCRALSATGVAGHPDEYFLTGDPSFFPPDWKFWEESPLARAHGVTDRRGYLDAVYDVGSTNNGVFGVKLMWNYLPDVLGRFRALPEFAALDRAQVLATAFPDARLVLLTRRDRVRQAVSWARAGLTGVYVVSDTEPAPPMSDPPYAFEFIADLEGLIVEGEHGWRSVATELDAVVHEVVYEDLLTTYEETVRGVMEFLGVDTSVAVPPPLTTRQSDSLNDEWTDRYLRDRQSGRAAD